MSRIIEGISPENLAKIRALKSSLNAADTPASAYFTPSEALLAEFGAYYGWTAVRDVLNHDVEAATFVGLLHAGRSRHLRQRAEHIADTYNAVACALSKKGDEALKRTLQKLERME